MRAKPYLYFNGRCEEAVQFYRTALNAQVSVMMRFKDAPMPHDASMGPQPPGDKIMHGSLQVGSSTLLVSDGHCKEPSATPFEGFSLALNTDSTDETDRIFAALSAGGTIRMPLTKTFFSPQFGMVIDRFGLLWTIITAEMPK